MEHRNAGMKRARNAKRCPFSATDGTGQPFVVSNVFRPLDLSLTHVKRLFEASAILKKLFPIAEGVGRWMLLRISQGRRIIPETAKEEQWRRVSRRGRLSGHATRKMRAGAGSYRTRPWTLELGLHVHHLRAIASSPSALLAHTKTLGLSLSGLRYS